MEVDFDQRNDGGMATITQYDEGPDAIRSMIRAVRSGKALEGLIVPVNDMGRGVSITSEEPRLLLWPSPEGRLNVTRLSALGAEQPAADGSDVTIAVDDLEISADGTYRVVEDGQVRPLRFSPVGPIDPTQEMVVTEQPFRYKSPHVTMARTIRTHGRAVDLQSVPAELERLAEGDALIVEVGVYNYTDTRLGFFRTGTGLKLARTESGANPVTDIHVTNGQLVATVTERERTPYTEVVASNIRGVFLASTAEDRAQQRSLAVPGDSREIRPFADPKVHSVVAIGETTVTSARGAQGGLVYLSDSDKDRLQPDTVVNSEEIVVGSDGTFRVLSQYGEEYGPFDRIVTFAVDGSVLSDTMNAGLTETLGHEPNNNGAHIG